MTEIANKHGGARRGAGRKKGSQNRQTTRQVQSLLEKYPMTPLELMLKVINDENEPIARRLKAAKAAAPYMHRRLASGEEEKPEPSFDLSKLTDEELDQYERLTAKVQRVDQLN